MSFITRGFRGRRRADAPGDRVPPGQYVTGDFPVLSAGPTPRVSLEEWRFTLTDTTGSEKSWSWDEFQELPAENFTVDIHCVTKWSKLDTTWQGVSLDTLLAGVAERGSHALFHCYGGYTTNLPLPDITGGKGWVAFGYEGESLAPEHGGPAQPDEWIGSCSQSMRSRPMSDLFAMSAAQPDSWRLSPAAWLSWDTSPGM